MERTSGFMSAATRIQPEGVRTMIPDETQSDTAPGEAFEAAAATHAATAAPTAERITTFNPATGEPLGEIPIAGEDEVRAAVATARQAQSGWAARPIEERIAVLRAFRRIMMKRADWLTDLIAREQGRPP